MKKILLSSFLVILVFPVLAQDNACPCTPGTDVTRQHRTKAKHETEYGNYFLKKDTITVSYIYKWQAKYQANTDGIVTNPQNPKSYRLKQTPEDTLYILSGYLWFVKQEDNDCDFHIEIGPKSKSGQRIVVEVPAENASLQASIHDYLEAKGLKIVNCNTSNSVKAHFATGIKVVVTGLGFYDASHKPNTNHGDSHTKKYSWELHPVRNIVFVN
jgi:hypothetical protein